jgi:hypothetical protein
VIIALPGKHKVMVTHRKNPYPSGEGMWVGGNGLVREDFLEEEVYELSFEI